MPNFADLAQQRLSFGRRKSKIEPDAATKPGALPLLTAKQQTRRMAALKAAAGVLEHLPGPGESLHVIMTGYYDMTDVVAALFDKIGPVDHLRIATLSFARRNIDLIARWIDAQKVKRIGLYCSKFFERHNKEFSEEMKALLTRTGNTYATGRNHAKVITLRSKEIALTIEGSANLRTCDYREQFALVNDPTLHDWYANWIDSEIEEASQPNEDE